jgi:hypothetical protein
MLYSYNTKLLFFSVSLLFFLGYSQAGLLSYGICQTGCNTLHAACYVAVGLTFGTMTAGSAITAVTMGCSSALGVRMSGCIADGYNSFIT